MTTCLMCLFILLAGDGFSDGTRAYVEGRFEEAFEAFASVEKAEGSDASPELLYNEALAALRIDKPLEAESAMEKAVARGGDDFVSLRDFVMGNAAFLRGLHAERVAGRPEAEPFAYDVAIRYVTKAQTYWIRAAMSRPDWPEARRNVERAQRKLISLQKTKKEKQQDLKSFTQIKVQPRFVPQAPSDKEQGKSEEEAGIDARKQKLSSSEIKTLYDKLDEKEKEKRKLRREQQQHRKTAGERDW